MQCTQTQSVVKAQNVFVLYKYKYL